MLRFMPYAPGKSLMHSRRNRSVHAQLCDVLGRRRSSVQPFDNLLAQSRLPLRGERELGERTGERHRGRLAACNKEEQHLVDDFGFSEPVGGVLGVARSQQ